jgi:hypothetical protein
MDDEPVITSNNWPMPQQPKRRGRKPRPTISEDELFGGGHVAKLQEHLGRLRAGEHGNRELHFDSLATALLLAFYNPTCRTLRTIEGLSQLASVQGQTGIDKICRTTTSDAMACFNPALLLPTIEDLRNRLPALERADRDLAKIVRQVIAADGSYFNIYADVAWAIHLTRRSGRDGAEIRLNLQLDVRNLAPVHASISGDDGCSEGAAFIPDLVADAIYLSDRNFVNFAFMSAVLAKGSDFVVRAKHDAPNFSPKQERELTGADKDHGVVSDRIGILTGRDAPSQLVREVVIVSPDTDKPIRLITSLLDVPARVIGVLYRNRWQIELFFRWLKVWGNFEHLISHSRNGLTIQFYIAVIGVLLMYVRTGRRVSKYAYSLLTMVATGAASLQEIGPILEQREREKELERQRLARKRAQRLGQ